MGETNGGLVKLGPASPMRPARLQRAGGTAKPAFIASVTVLFPERLPLFVTGTGSSNPASSTGESANSRSPSGGRWLVCAVGDNIREAPLCRGFRDGRTSPFGWQAIFATATRDWVLHCVPGDGTPPQ
jgi:hypothetical protein